MVPLDLVKGGLRIVFPLMCKDTGNRSMPFLLSGLTVLLLSGWMTEAHGQAGFYETGKSYRYQYRVASRGAGQFGQLNQLFAPQKLSDDVAEHVTQIEARFDAEVDFVVLDNRGTSMLMALLIHRAKVDVKIDDIPVQRPARELEKALPVPCYFTMDMTGRVQNLWLPPTSSPTHHQFVREVLSSFQNVIPQRSETTWNTMELLAAGRFEAHYRKGVNTGPTAGLEQAQGRGLLGVFTGPIWHALSPTQLGYSGTLIKTLIGHRPLKTKWGPKMTPPPTDLMPTSQISVDYASGLITKIQGKSSLRIRVKDKDVSYSETVLHVKQIGVDMVSASRRAQLHHQIEKKTAPVDAMKLWSAVLSWAEKSEIYSRNLKQWKRADLLAMLDKLEAESEDVDHGEIYTLFKSFVFLRPDRLDPLISRLRTAKMNRPTLTILSAALSNAGTAAAQDGLRQAIRSREKEPKIAIQMLAELALTKRPDNQTIALFIELGTHHPHEGLRRAAWIASGSLALMTRDDVPQESEKIVTWLVQQLRASTMRGHRIDILRGLGNSGSVTALKAAQPYLTDADPEVRARALGVARWVRGPEAESLLTQAIYAKAPDAVKLEALAGLSIRPLTESTYQARIHALSMDPSSTVRLAALANVWTIRDARPGVIKVIRKTAKDEIVESIRDEARRLLERYQEEKE